VRELDTYCAGVVAFETERLVVRGYLMSDAADALEMYSDPEVVRFLVGMPIVVDLEEQRAFIQRVLTKYEAMPPGFGGWAVVEKESGRVVGTAMLKPAPLLGGAKSDDVEIGWHLARRVWGRGYATEIGRALVKRGREVPGARRILALIEPPNERSAAVARRLGMRDEGLSHAFYEGEPLRLFVAGD
jgi:RimJ/RimL family protein N-acetyltransferase